MSDIKFIDGLMAKAPHDKAPEYVKARLSIKRQELIDWLQGQDGDWINADVKEAKSGNWYVAVDEWKPNQGNTSTSGARGRAPQRQRPASAAQQSAPIDDFEDDSIPFATNRGVF